MKTEELRALAEAAMSLNEPWWDLGDNRISSSFCGEDASYIAAASPAAIIALLDEIDCLTSDMKDRIRERDYAHDVIDSYKEQVDVLTAERDALRTSLKNLLEDTQHKHHEDCDEGPCPVREARELLKGQP